MPQPQSAISDQLDVAVVGGGASGLYTAWRLLREAREQGGPVPKVAVFELSERVGGRLLTWLPAGPDGGLRAELGGMRFLAEQQLVWNLLDQLGLGASFVPFWVEGNDLRLMLRGVSTVMGASDPTARYLVDPKVQGKGAGDALYEVIEEVLATEENAAVLKKVLGGKFPATREQWDQVKPLLTWRGKPLWDVGFWNLLSDIRNPETYQYFCDAFGYYSIATNWNAAEAMQSVALDFSHEPGKPEYRTLREGYSALPDALAEQVIALGGQIRTENRLVSFEAVGGGSTVASFATHSGTYQVLAGSLVLGLPRRSLELLAPSPDFDPQGDPALRRLLESVVSMPAFKLFLFFRERWWEKLGIDRGRSVSDMPIRQTYYMAPDAYYENQPCPPWGVLMASYDDARAVDFWQGLVPPAEEWEEGRRKLRSALVDLVSGTGGAENDVPEPPPHLHLASEGMEAHALEQLARLHDIPLAQIPQPIVGAFADWGFDPFGGGWNFWEPQVDVREAMTAIKQPFGDELRAYVVGESYSGVQGWVEGALTVAELVLQKHFGLSRPPWLPSDYYLGW
ncbi:MAG: flavin monoamine oxidase family protein [Solirubrobacterales bacterium]